MMRAKDIARRIENGETTPAHALAACQEAMAGGQHLHVFAHEAPAMAAAASGPLRGVGLGVKDIFDTHDMPTSHGSPIYEGHVPKADAALVAMARTAGATIVGKTVTTEFAWFHPGATVNPHDPAHTPGGSSSGSAAGVAAGLFPAALGSQTGGSVIRPASFCGVVGFKPSFRLLPTIGMKCFSWSLDTAGLFAATVDDVAFAAAALTRRDLESSESSAPRIGLVRSSIDGEADRAMHEAWERVARQAERAGATLRDAHLPKLVDDARHAHPTVQDFEAAQALHHERRHHAELLSPVLRAHLDRAATIEPSAYDAARRTANRARKAAHDLFADVDVLLCPSAPGPAPKGLASTGDSVFNRLWTLLGVPCVNVPAGHDGALPLGLQVIAPFGRDREALAAAAWLEGVIA